MTSRFSSRGYYFGNADRGSQGIIDVAVVIMHQSTALQSPNNCYSMCSNVRATVSATCSFNGKPRTNRSGASKSLDLTKADRTGARTLRQKKRETSDCYIHCSRSTALYPKSLFASDPPGMQSTYCTVQDCNRRRSTCWAQEASWVVFV